MISHSLAQNTPLSLNIFVSMAEQPLTQLNANNDIQWVCPISSKHGEHVNIMSYCICFYRYHLSQPDKYPRLPKTDKQPFRFRGVVTLKKMSWYSNYFAYLYFDVWHQRFKRGRTLLFIPQLSYQWRRPLWTVFHVRCTRAAAPRCRWFVWRCVGEEVQTYTGWWSFSWVKGLCLLMGEVGPVIPHYLNYKEIKTAFRYNSLLIYICIKNWHLTDVLNRHRGPANESSWKLISADSCLPNGRTQMSVWVDVKWKCRWTRKKYDPVNKTELVLCHLLPLVNV